MLKIEENPPIAYPELPLEQFEGPWRVAHTKSRNEKALAWQLNRWGIPYFLPLIPHTYRRNGRKFQSMLPLFSGYVFFCGDDEKRYQTLTTNRVSQIIEVIDQNGLLRELNQINRALNSGLPVDPHPYLKEGTRCRVKAGPLMGFEGIVIQKKNVFRILLKVEMLGQAAAVEIDADVLEPLE